MYDGGREREVRERVMGEREVQERLLLREKQGIGGG